MKNMSSVIYTFCISFLVFFPHQANAQISPEVERALRDAKISVFEQRTEPTDFTLPLLGGENVSLSSYKGKVVILNFWATWCPPCRAEMPSMETLYKSFNGQGLEILAVDIGEDTSTVQKFIRSNGYTYPILLDSSKKISSIYGIKAIPTTYIIDREGKIIGRVIGSIKWDNKKVISAIEALIKS